MKSILITGASGFIGSFIVEEALRRGLDTWAGVRASSSRRYLQDPDIHFIELDFGNSDRFRAALAAHKAYHGPFDYVVYCAGVTKCVDKDDFMRVNHAQTEAFAETLRALDMVPHRFIYLSSLSVFGPIHENDYAPITDADTPQPNTAYGSSKRHAELYIQSLSDFPYVIFRPTGVYGPRERDYFLMARSIRRHVDFSVGYRRQDITFVYVKDVVQAIFCAIDKDVNRRTYFLSDGEVYSSRHFSDLIRRELGNPWLLRIKSPLWLLRVISQVSEWLSHLTGKAGTLNTDKCRIMAQRNWRCDIQPAIDELGYCPQYNLERGVGEMMEWYQAEGWL